MLARRRVCMGGASRAKLRPDQAMSHCPSLRWGNVTSPRGFDGQCHIAWATLLGPPAGVRRRTCEAVRMATLSGIAPLPEDPAALDEYYGDPPRGVRANMIMTI